MAQNTSLASRFMTWLRGDAKSIKGRFYYRPKERLDLIYNTKIKGESYTEWYRRRMNRMAAKSSKMQRPVSQRYLDNAQIQVRYLQHKGMKSSDDVLEYGCGILRVGLHLIPLLDDHKYTAADISDLRVEKGVGILKENGIDPSRYRTVIVTTAEAKELGDAKYDIILCHDVMCHMPLDECYVSMKALQRVLKPGGSMYVTFDVADKPRSTNAKDYWFSPAQIEDLGRAAGLVAKAEQDWMDFKLDIQDTQQMYSFTHKEAGA